MRLLLFDIDGTLLRSNRVGRTAMHQPLLDIFGATGPLDTYEFAGKTDRAIVRDLMRAEGWTDDDIAARLPALDRHMTAAGREMFTPENVWPYPGVLELLDTLAGRDDVVLSLLTGNIRPTAVLKLAAAGINPALFVDGAYGSDSHERNDLFAIALQRVGENTGLQFAAKNVIIVGDTPADILCARSGGGRAIAVATGPYSMDVLAEYQPDHLFADLTRIRDVLDAVLRPAELPSKEGE